MYTIGEFAERVNLNVKTLQRWDREGKLVAKRTLTGRRYYTDEDVAAVLTGTLPVSKKRIIGYCRVSSHNQKADLANQRGVLELYCSERGLEVDEWVEEVGGGLNLRRKQFLRIIDGILEGEIGSVVVTHKDRLARFGYDLIQYLCERSGCEVIVMENESLSPEQELVQDLLTIVHTFSSRLYGLRNYRKALEKALHDDTSTQNPTEPHA